jgi:LPS-assembly lipoprotein
MISRPGQADRILTSAVLLFAAVATAACGFHLRGSDTYGLSPELATLRVAVEGSQLQNDPLLVAMKDALLTQTDIQVVDTGKVPLLQLFGEHFDKQVLSVDSTGKVAEYLLKYQVSFRLADTEGKLLSESQTIRVQRDQSFDPTNVLLTEREIEEQRRNMRRDAVQQILRRLVHINPENPRADQR